MSINSFTALASGDVTNVSSTLLFCVWSDTAYKISIEQIANIGVADIGARWIANSDQNLAANSTHLISRHFGSLYYDTNSWTDAATPGIFRVPNDKYTHVEVGFCLYVGGQSAGFAQAWMGVNCTGTVAPCAFDRKSGNVFTRLQGVSPPLPVSSGDVIEPLLYVQDTGSIQAANQKVSIWIRGIRATP